ncbi:UNVERIFIED_CONTAM: hypothetical protein RMT77_015481 [Armadillidium vulgare]
MDLTKFLVCFFLFVSLATVIIESAPAPAPAPAPVPGPSPNPDPVPEPKWKRKFPGQRRIGAVNYGFYKFGKRGYETKGTRRN